MEWGTDGPFAKHSGTKDAKSMKCIHLARPLTSPEPATRRGVWHRRCLFWQKANRTPEIYMHISLSQKANGTVGTLCSVNDGTEACAGRIIPSSAYRQREAAVLGLQCRPRGSQKSPGFSLPLPQSGIPGYSFLTSSGSESLNSQPSPVQLMKDWQDLSVSNSRRNCHSWIGPLPGSTRHEESLPTPSKPTAAAPAPSGIAAPDPSP